MPNISIYTPVVVQQLLDFYGPLLDREKFEGKISMHLDALAGRLFEGIQKGSDAVLTEVNNYHPDYLGIAISSLKARELNLQTARETIASEYGFKNLQVVAEGRLEYNPAFEQSVFLLLQGNIRALKECLSASPELLTARSNYGHRATLLHYTANNGVEFWRQSVPENLAEIADVLIDMGADKKATMTVYKGEYTPYELAATSAHPRDAGIAAELLAVLG